MKQKKNLFKAAFLVVLLCSISASALAQASAKVAGQVTDKKTGETLIGLTVKINGTNGGVSTNVEGRYVLTGLNPGKYSLVFTYVGYQPKLITDVEVLAGKVTPLDVQMEEASTQTLKEVVITATIRQESISGLYAKQKTNISISDGISSDQIRKSPDRSTSEVLKRVSGTSIQDNKFVIVRGLADRYNSTLLNNAVLPSSEPDKKAFSFDIIPSNLIDNIVINKTASPELPGDFSGGVVQIITKDVPEQSYFSFSTGLGYNSLTTFKSFELGQRGANEFFGLVGSFRNLPANLPSTNAFREFSAQQKIDAGKLFSNSFQTNPISSARPTQNYQANLGIRKTFKNDANLGATFSLTYRNAENASQSERFDYESAQKQYDFKDQVFKYSTSLGALANVAYVNGNSKISFKNIYNISSDNSFTTRTGIQFLEQDSIKGYSLDYVSKSLLNTQLEGEHKFSWKDLKWNWNVNYSYSDRLQPDLKSINYRLDYDQGATQYEAIVPNGTASRTDASRFFSDMFEDSFGGSTSATLPLSFFKEKTLLKVGYFKQHKVRDFGARKFGYIKSFGAFNANLLTLPYNQLFASQNLAVGSFIMDEGTENSDRYDATSDINATYVQFDQKFGEKLRLVWGARMEDGYQLVNTFDFSGQRLTVNNSFTDVLPSLNTSYNLSEKSVFRVSASQTVTRPELRELTNFGFFDYVSKRILQGNPDLKRSQNTNLDVKYEWYPGAGQIVSVSGFYKFFKNPIEQIVSSGSVRNITFQNAESARTSGFEIELRKRLDFLGKAEWTKNLVAYANASVIFSTVNLNNLVSEVTSRSLQGQSPYIINAGLLYTSAKNDLSFNLLYNRIGERISEVGYQGYPDIYERGRDIIDFQVSKKVLKTKGELRLNLSDILNQNIVFYQNMNDKKTYQSGQDFLMNSAQTGRGVSLSFIYNFNLDK